MSSPTARSLAECRASGLVAGVVEKFIPQRKIRVDLFGFVDIVALDPARGSIHFIQTTSGAHHANREAKILEWPHLEALSLNGNVEVWSWSQRVTRRKDGTKAKVKRWTLRRTWAIKGDAGMLFVPLDWTVAKAEGTTFVWPLGHPARA